MVTLFAFTSQFSEAQLKLPLANGVAPDVKKVVGDYPNRFINLMGEVKSANAQWTDYECNFRVSGAEEAFITRYTAKKEVCSWEAVMLTTESFEKARQKYHALFNQLNNLSVSFGDGHSYKLKGNYETPQEQLKFSSVLFTINPGTEAGKKLKVEIALQFFAPMEWKVKVLVYDREREDDERGETRETD